MNTFLHEREVITKLTDGPFKSSNGCLKLRDSPFIEIRNFYTNKSFQTLGRVEI